MNPTAPSDVSPMSMRVTPEIQKKMEDIVSKYESKQAALLPILSLFQKEQGYIQPGVEKIAAEFLDLPVIKVEEVISFYTLYSKKHPGKAVIRVCQTTSCFLRGCEDVIRYLEKRLNIKSGEVTSDGKFGLNRVECLGACEMAPMMQIGDKYVGPLTRGKVDEVLKKYGLP